MIALFMTAAADWCDSKDVPFNVRRTEMGDWYVSLEFKDSAGWFSKHLNFMDRGQVEVATEKGRKYRKETDDEYIVRVERALHKACADARRNRVVRATGVDPLIGRAT